MCPANCYLRHVLCLIHVLLLSIVLSSIVAQALWTTKTTAKTTMMRSSGSAEQPVEHVADSSAEQPAHGSAELQNRMAPLTPLERPLPPLISSFLEEDLDSAGVTMEEVITWGDEERADNWFGNVERLFRKPLWKDEIPLSDTRPWPLIHCKEASFRQVASFRSLPESLQSRLVHDLGLGPTVFLLATTPRNILWSFAVCANLKGVLMPDALESLDVLSSSVSHVYYSGFEMLRTNSSTVEPSSTRPPAVLLSAMPGEALMIIASYVGAHNLATIWECSECSPEWYGWYCTHCHLPSKYLHWSYTSHFGYCGIFESGYCAIKPEHGETAKWLDERAKLNAQKGIYNRYSFCGCCHSRIYGFGCESCDDLLDLKKTCQTMRDLLKRYNGT